MKIAALIFAAWEIGKMVIGETIMHAKPALPEVGCAVIMFEFPYMAWAVWLIFHDPVGAVVLWTLGIVQMVFTIRGTEPKSFLYSGDCALSAILLVAIYAGWI